MTRPGSRTRHRVLRAGVAPVAGVALPTAACVNGVNYPDAAGPRFAGVAPSPAPPSEGRPGPDGAFRVVSYNVEEGRAWRQALEVLQEDSAMASADIVLLQEMEEGGVAAMARALRMHWVYYPAMARGGERRHFGNAVLSRWPIAHDEKLVLPHPGVFVRTQRIATAATVAAPSGPVTVYSVHLGTPVNTFRRHRRAQFEAILDHAARHPRVVIGGDLNGTGPVDLALERGYRWPTREGPNTLWIGRWDHILVKGLDHSGRSAGTGSPRDGVSDHRPVWATVVLPAATDEPEMSPGAAGGSPRTVGTHPSTPPHP